MILRALVVIALCGGVASAQPGSDPSVALRDANAAANAGDWETVRNYVEPLLARQLPPADLAEAYRLAGIAAVLAQPPRRDLAEKYFLEYLRIDLDGQLDPSLYPPEVVQVFSDVRSKHSAELRARRPKAKKRHAVVSLLPPFAQFQNGERGKGIVIGSLMGAFLIANITSYALLKSWCSADDLTCDEEKDRTSTAATVRSINITAGVGLIITYVYGVYDGVRGYRRTRAEPALMPYASSTNTSAVVGVRMNF